MSDKSGSDRPAISRRALELLGWLVASDDPRQRDGSPGIPRGLATSARKLGALDDAPAYLRANLHRNVIVGVACQDGTHVVGLLIDVLGTNAFVVERPNHARGDAGRVEVHLSNVSELAITMPGEVDGVFS